MKTKRKGFTIVELVIVIAVIAILAAVLIPVFSGIINKANESTDTQLVRNLNTVLAADSAMNGKHENMQSALDAVNKSGFDVAKIMNNKATENTILWDSKNDVFCYLKGDKVEYIPGIVDTSNQLNAGDYMLWKIYTASEKEKVVGTEEKYSAYLSGDGWTGDLTVSAKGIDVGKVQGITSVTYNGSVGSEAGQNVIVRTDGEPLTVNAANDDVKHYGFVGALNVTAVRADHCYHEYGFVGNLASFGTGKFVAESGAEFHQTRVDVENKLNGKSFDLDNGEKYEQHYYANGQCAICHADECQHVWGEGVVITAAGCLTDGTKELTCNICNATKTEVIPALGHDIPTDFNMSDDNQHWKKCSRCDYAEGRDPHTLTYANNEGETHDVNCNICGYSKTGVAHTFENGTCACGKTENIVKNGLVNGYYYLNDELYTGTINDNNKTIAFENGCLVVWAEDSLKQSGSYIVNHTFNKSSVDEKYLTDKIVLSSISSVWGDPGSQTYVSNKINIDFSGYSVESAKAYDPSIMYSLSSTPWNNATVYADYMKLISETCGNGEYGDPSTFPFYINSKDYTDYQLLSISELTFTDYLKLKYVSNIIVTSSTTAIETYLVKAGSEDKLSAYAYDNGKAGMGIILSEDGKVYFYSWSDLAPCFPYYIDISSNGTYASNGNGSGDNYSVNRNGTTITVSYKGTTIDTLTLTKNTISNFNLNEQKTAISGMSIAGSCSIEELLALATDPSNRTQMRIDQAPEVLELFIKAFWSTYSFSNDSGATTCSFNNFNATFLKDNNYEYVVQFVNGIGNAYQGMEHVGPIIKIIISKN